MSNITQEEQDNKQPEGMPMHYIKIARALIKSYGKTEAVRQIEDNIAGLSNARRCIGKDFTATKISIACQSDFWSQVLKSIK